MAPPPRVSAVHGGRLDYYGRRLLLPELRHLGWDRWTRARPEALGPHVHAHGWEICQLVAGEVEWWVEDEVHRVTGGSCYVTRPGERHGGVDRVMHPCELRWVQVVLPPQGPLPGLARVDARQLARAFAGMRRRVFPATPTLSAAFHRLLEEHRGASDFALIAARAALHTLLAEIARCFLGLAPRHSPSEPIRRALELLAQRLDRPPSIPAIARAVGLGPSRFHERFVAEIGATPVEYLTRRRIERAQTMLRDGASVARAASSVGFTREYFTLVFRRLVGHAPGAWRDLEARR